jgi:hypothetical protein
LSVKSFDPGQIAVILGPSILGGFAEDSVVEVARTESTWTTTVGADGEVTRTRNRNKSGTVKVKLLRTSASNDVLSALHAQDQLFGTGILPITIKDLLGTTLHFGSNAWVEKPADDSIDKDMSSREWTIAVGDLDMFDGGSVVSAP